MKYYYIDGQNRAVGPVSLEELYALVPSGIVNASTMIAPVGSQQWVPITTLISTIAPASKESLAIWSFVLSLIGLFCCGFLTGIPAVICGHLALFKINQNPRLQGRGFAIAGLIIGYVSIVFYVVYLFFLGGVAFLQGLSSDL